MADALHDRIGPHHRFRRRLTAAFVIVAAMSAGAVAIVTFVLAREYRWRTVHKVTRDEARFAVALAPERLDTEGFQRLRAAYETRTRADVLAIGPSGEHSSSPTLSIDDIPVELRGPLDERDPPSTETTVDHQPALIVAAPGPGATSYYFVFPLQDVHASLNELAQVAVAAWAVTTAAAGAVGQIIARTALRPIAAAADAAETIASGDLTARLSVASDDEFGALASSFNHMADEVQTLVAELEEAARRQRRFTADVAHELRTPLTGITATASVLEELIADLPAPARRPAAVLATDVRRLRDLVLELLELVRLEAATEPVRPEPLRVRTAVEAILRSPGASRDAALEVDISEDLVVLAEPIRLRRILGNLIDNAVVHGGSNVRVQGRDNDGTARIDVIDDGPGISPEEVERVFDRFYKSDASRTRGGSGLGLAIARQHARVLGGDLTATSGARGGAIFTLHLPTTATDGDTNASPPASRMQDDLQA